MAVARSERPWFQLEDRHGGVLALRLAAAAVVALAALVPGAVPDGTDPAVVIPVCALAAALQVALWRVPLRWPRRLRLAVDLSLVVDAAWATALVAVAGGSRGPVAALFVVTALWAALGYSARTGVKAGVLASIGFLTIVWEDDGRLWSAASLGRLAFLWGVLAAAVLGAATGERELVVRARRLEVLHGAARDLLAAPDAATMTEIARAAGEGLMPGWRVDVRRPDAATPPGAWLGRDGGEGVVLVPVEVAGNAVALIGCRRALARGRRRHRIRRRDLEGLETLAAGLGSALWRAALVDDIRRQSLTDGLTGIANRRSFDIELARRLAEGARSGAPVALCMVDIDHFKSFNDTFGHQAGDEAIATVAAVLARTCRAGDIPARYGGEEMALILPGAGEEEALMVGERVRAAIAATPVGPRAVSVSVGVAVSRGGCSPEVLVEAADRALYEAKEGGRNRVVAGAAAV
ncbi:MAG: diguanylate cyclase [Thermoleophilia bacterium]